MKKLLLIFALAIVCACSNQELIESFNTDDSSLTRAQLLVKEFAKDVSGDKSGDVDLTFTFTTKKDYVALKNSGDELSVVEKNFAISRGLEGEDFQIETVHFNTEVHEGFAVVGLAEDFERVFFFTQNGNTENASEIEALQQYLNNVPDFFADVINNSGTLPPPTPQTPYYNPVGILVKTEWGQDAPYNNDMPYCEVSSHQHESPTLSVVGCGGIAVGQFIASQGRYTMSDGTGLNLSSVASHPTPYQSEQSLVSSFLRDVVDGLHSTVSCQSTSTTVSRISLFLTSIGYNVVQSTTLSLSILYARLMAGYPIIVYGSGSSGHFWIVDDLRGSGDAPYFHCNWGWNGSCNGWSYCNPYTVTSSTSYPYGNEFYYIN